MGLLVAVTLLGCSFALRYTRLAPVLGLARPNLTAADLVLALVTGLLVFKVVVSPRRSLTALLRAFRADRLPSDEPRSSGRAWPARLVLGSTALVLLLAVEAPAKGPPPIHGARIAERGAYPSLVASCLTGDFVFNADAAGGLFGLAHLAYPELRKLEAPLWASQIGTGRPLYPVDCYSLGTLNPITWGALALASDTNRVFVLSYVLHLVFTVGAFYFLFSHGGVDPLAATLGSLLIFSGSFLHLYPNYVEGYLLPVASVIVLVAIVTRFMEHGGLMGVPVVALAVGGFALASIVCVPVCGLAVVGTWFASGCARRTPWRVWCARGALLCAALGLAGALSLAHFLPLRVFAAECTNRFLPYIGETVDAAKGIREFCHWFVQGPLPWSLAMVGLIEGALARRRKSLHFAATTLLALSLLGFLGAFDRIALAVGFNAQRINTYGPVAAAAGALLAGLGAEALLVSRRNVLVAVAWIATWQLHHRITDSNPATVSISLPPALLLLSGWRPRALRDASPSVALALAFAATSLAAAVFSPSNSILNGYLTGWRLPDGVRQTAWRCAIGAALLAVAVGHAPHWRRWTRRLPRSVRARQATLRYLAAALYVLVAAIFWAELSPRRDYLVSSPIDAPVLPPGFERIVRAAGQDFRIACLYAREGEGPFPAAITYETADEVPLYHLEAPLYGYHDATGSASLTIARYSDFVDHANYGCSWRDDAFQAAARRDPELYRRVCSFKRINIVALNPYSSLWKYTALRYIISRERLDDGRLVFVEAVEKPVTYGRHMDPRVRLDRVYIYERPDAYPRVYVPDTVAVVASVSEDDPKTLAAAPPEAGRFAVIADPTRGGRELRTPGPKSAKIVEETTRSITLEVECASDAYVVLSDAWFPGWTATLDGQEAELLLANYAFRAVRVPPGKHRVVMSFLPRAILVGGAISGVTLAICLAGVVFLTVRRRAANPAPASAAEPPPRTP